MELQRLQPMKEGYDVKTFNELHKRTRRLKKKLVSQIDSRRFGVTPDIIESWFDDKFIQVFNKYMEHDKEVLLGHIINSLQTFKFRVLRNAYTQKNEFYNNFISIPESSDDDHDSFLARIPDTNEENAQELFHSLIEEFMIRKLSDDARLIWEIEMNPPLYITSQLGKKGSRIPARLIAEYLELEAGKKANRFINTLREEIRGVTEQAKKVLVPQTLSMA